MIVVYVVVEKFINPDVLLRVLQYVWVRKGGIELRALNRSMFLFYFVDVKDVKFIPNKAKWNFNNFLMTVKQLESSVHP